MLNTRKNTFTKSERLCSISLINEVFEKGMSITAYPLKAVFLSTELQLKFPAQTMFVVPKRAFKRSPDRNTLRRRIKEAYRIDKSILYMELSSSSRKVLAAIIYTSRKEEDFNVIRKAVQKIMKEIPLRL